MINHLIPKDSGNINLGSRVKIGYYDQEHQILSLHKTIFEEISDTYPDLTNTRIRNVLAAFLFTGEDVFKKIGDLSGGERGRVSLAKLMLSPANFLILDEPTNHLDIQSKEILEEAIKNYAGTVLFVSHDRYFINTISTRIIELKDKQLYSFIGDYNYYETHRDTVYGVQKDAHPSPAGKLNFSAVNPVTDTTVTTKSGNLTGNSNPDSALSNKESYIKNKEEQARIRKNKNALKKTETMIAELEERIEAIDAQINAPENATNSVKLGELSSEREALDEELMNLYETWDNLSSEDN